MPLTKWRRPHHILLPGKYRIPIRYMTAKQMKRTQEKDPTMSKSDLNGYWDGERIVINTSEPLYMQIETLGHELVHAIHDYSLWLKQQYADPIAQECGQTVGDLMEDDD